MAKAAYAAGPALLGDPALADCVIFCSALPFHKAIGPRKRGAPKSAGLPKARAPKNAGLQQITVKQINSESTGSGCKIL